MPATSRESVPHSLQHRVVASVMLGLGIVLVGIGYLVAPTVAQTTEFAVQERLALARAKQHELDQEVRDALELLNRMALERPAGTMAHDPAEARRRLQHITGSGVFSRAALVDLRRGTVAAVGPEAPRWV